MFCMNCGKQYEEGLNFCPYCGAKAPRLKEKAAAAERAEQTVPAVWSQEWAAGRPVSSEGTGSAVPSAVSAPVAPMPPMETAEIPAVPYGAAPYAPSGIPEWNGENGAEPLGAEPPAVPYDQPYFTAPGISPSTVEQEKEETLPLFVPQPVPAPVPAAGKAGKKRKKWPWIVFPILGLLGIAAVLLVIFWPKGGGDGYFRNTRWGMTEEEVRASESTELLRRDYADGSFSLSGVVESLEELKGLSCKVYYFFTDQGVLYGAQYTIPPYSSLSEHAVQEAMEKAYGLAGNLFWEGGSGTAYIAGQSILEVLKPSSGFPVVWYCDKSYFQKKWPDVYDRLQDPGDQEIHIEGPQPVLGVSPDLSSQMVWGMSLSEVESALGVSLQWEDGSVSMEWYTAELAMFDDFPGETLETAFAFQNGQLVCWTYRRSGTDPSEAGQIRAIYAAEYSRQYLEEDGDAWLLYLDGSGDILMLQMYGGEFLQAHVEPEYFRSQNPSVYAELAGEDFVEDQDGYFRGTRWGMTPEQVQSAEGMSGSLESAYGEIEQLRESVENVAGLEGISTELRFLFREGTLFAVSFSVDGTLSGVSYEDRVNFYASLWGAPTAGTVNGTPVQVFDTGNSFITLFAATDTSSEYSVEYMQPEVFRVERNALYEQIRSGGMLEGLEQGLPFGVQWGSSVETVARKTGAESFGGHLRLDTDRAPGAMGNEVSYIFYFENGVLQSSGAEIPLTAESGVTYEALEQYFTELYSSAVSASLEGVTCWLLDAGESILAVSCDDESRTEVRFFSREWFAEAYPSQFEQATGESASGSSTPYLRNTTWNMTMDQVRASETVQLELYTYEDTEEIVQLYGFVTDFPGLEGKEVEVDYIFDNGVLKYGAVWLEESEGMPSFASARDQILAAGGTLVENTDGMIFAVLLGDTVVEVMFSEEYAEGECTVWFNEKAYYKEVWPEYYEQLTGGTFL